MKPRVYEGKFKQVQILDETTLYFRFGPQNSHRIETLFEEFADDGKLYRITVQEIKERKEPSPVPIVAEKELVPA